MGSNVTTIISLSAKGRKAISRGMVFKVGEREVAFKLGAGKVGGSS